MFDKQKQHGYENGSEEEKRREILNQGSYCFCFLLLVPQTEPNNGQEHHMFWSMNTTTIWVFNGIFEDKNKDTCLNGKSKKNKQKWIVNQGFFFFWLLPSFSSLWGGGGRPPLQSPRK